MLATIYGRALTGPPPSPPKKNFEPSNSHGGSAVLTALVMVLALSAPHEGAHLPTPMPRACLILVRSNPRMGPEVNPLQLHPQKGHGVGFYDFFTIFFEDVFWP